VAKKFWGCHRLFPLFSGQEQQRLKELGGKGGRDVRAPEKAKTLQCNEMQSNGTENQRHAFSVRPAPLFSAWQKQQKLKKTQKKEKLSSVVSRGLGAWRSTLSKKPKKRKAVECRFERAWCLAQHFKHFIANKLCSIFFSAFSTALGLIYSVVVAGNVKLSAEQRPDRWLLPFP